MDRIMAAMTYNRICELGSLSAAARSLGISRPMVSRYLDEMEKWAGARLIHRSTRRLTLTPAGEKILEKTRQLASLSQDIEGDATRLTPSGTLRIACAHFTATHLLGPVIPAFLARYPALRIEVDINNQPVSLVGERIDLAIRITNSPEPGVIARALGECRSVLCASPGYLARAGQPETLDDLAQHNCLHYSRFSGQSWTFRDPEKGTVAVAVNGNFSAGISSLLCDMAMADVGLALVPEIEARMGLQSGQLVSVLPQLEPQPLGIYGLYQSRDHQHAALGLFLDAIKQHLAA
ncbi:LysR family transcriptional regulator [Phytobacter diazotrophicus]|jgi:DNA-binding transcriptional LysR family regulator|uniref:LysR family transcriptional regulator n=1 Tax=Phytobacter diazotrophicus TaxID=395631 RepID=A0ABN6LUM5_9ENTR|nr:MULTISPECIES: LysR family transcriptional regulator [Phytobacter]MBS6737235.1 LysR family transcriptional regulator [Enterobacteriaceae bacterium]QIH64636.1 LysR family transcriptional regulator [Enterobacteriaceae bacterium A-F18]MDU4153830.1 LysR family transcriptional regulator [Enterobacteriaceae bacterium]MDU4354812.1 LysR family transcriptional regulator [Phytobacter diazotrophicus]MDU7130387.1 LysR family transcriptional regulator [Enterobacteriaceae bacterium]